MKQYLIFGIFLYVSRHQKTTAKCIAENFEISTRSVYRYVDALTIAGIPFITEKGKNGGISIAKNFLLENYVLSQKEKDTIKSALKDMPCGVKNILNKICV